MIFPLLLSLSRLYMLYTYTTQGPPPQPSHTLLQHVHARLSICYVSSTGCHMHTNRFPHAYEHRRPQPPVSLSSQFHMIFPEGNELPGRRSIYI